MAPLTRMNFFRMFHSRRGRQPANPSSETPQSFTPAPTTTTYPSRCFYCPKMLASEASRSQHVDKWLPCREAEQAVLAESAKKRTEAREAGEPLDLRTEGQACIRPLPASPEHTLKRPRTDDTSQRAFSTGPSEQSAPIPVQTSKLGASGTEGSSAESIPIFTNRRPKTAATNPTPSSSSGRPDRGWIDPVTGYYVEPFPDQLAGAPISDEVLPPTDLDSYMRASGNLGDPKAFAMAELLLTTGLSDKAKNLHLQSPVYVGNVPWCNTDHLYTDVDQLRHGPSWHMYEIDVHHPTHSRVQYLVTREIGDMICDIIADPTFKDDLAYAPVRLWTTPEKKDRVYGDMWTGDWWWNMQIRLRSKPGPATLVPLVIATDQTKLSTMCGGQKAYPVYVTLGNIGKDVRRKPSRRATILLGYLPVDGFEDIENDDERRRMKAELIHRSMEAMLRPLQEASENGIDVWCADGRLRRVYPMISTHIANWPEQNLHACTSEGSCPICVTRQKGRGDINQPRTLRDRGETLNAIRAYFTYKSKAELKHLSLKPVWPWWACLPDMDFTTCVTPDMLHQLYQGIFKTHLVRWVQYLIGIKKLDSHFIATTQASGMTHFGKGISRVQQWTGRESKEMLKQFVPLVVGELNPELAKLVTSAVDFIYRTHASSMTETDLIELDKTLETFHKLKDLMVSKGFYPSAARFDKIPKIHMLSHYTHSIRMLGTPDGYSTEAPEYLHIEFAKTPWRVSSKVRPLQQMITYIQRMDSVRIHRAKMNEWLIQRGLPPKPRVQTQDESETEDRRQIEGGREIKGGRKIEGGREIEGGRVIVIEDEDEDGDESLEVVQAGQRIVSATAGGSGTVRPSQDTVRGVGIIEGAGVDRENGGTAPETKTYYPDPIRQMAKRPTKPNLLVQDVIHDYGATDIKSAVSNFLNSRFDIPSYNSILSDAHRINVWHRFYMHHPPPPHAPLDPPRREVIRASPTTLDAGGRLRKIGVWDAAMYLERPNRLPCNRKYPDKRGIHRYRAGRVRAFFSLPPGLGRYYSGPLAYLELFSPFNTGSSPVHGLYSTSWDLTATGARRTLVLPVEDIVFACHLSPKFHFLKQDLRLSPRTDLFAISQHFWFNHFYSHYMYELVRHWRREPPESRSGKSA